MKKKARLPLTTPLWAYALVVVIILICILPPADLVPTASEMSLHGQEVADRDGEGARKSSWWQEHRCDIGIGMIGSLFCSFLIDLGNTRNAQEKQTEDIDTLKKSIKTRWGEIKYILEKSAVSDETTDEDQFLQLYAFKDGTEGGISTDAQKMYRGMIQTALIRVEESCNRLEEYRIYGNYGLNENVTAAIENFRKTAMEFRIRAESFEKNECDKHKLFTRGEDNAIKNNNVEATHGENEPPYFIELYTNMKKSIEIISPDS